MSLSRSARVVTAAFAGFLFAQAHYAAAARQAGAGPSGQVIALADSPPATCPVTLPGKGKAAVSSRVRATSIGIAPDGIGGMVTNYGTEKLSTMLPVDGVWRGSGSGQNGDYAYANKLPWRGEFSYTDGPLTVTGKRLDGPAPSFTYIQEIFGRHGIMGGIEIPTFGCWELTARYKDSELSFVIWVTQLREPQSASNEPSPSSPRPPAQEPKLPRIQVDGEVEARQLVFRVMPEIPREAQVANVSGTVVLHAIIGWDSRPHEIEYVSGPGLLKRAAIDAVRWWQYRLSTEEPTEIDTTISVEFPSANN